MAGSSSGRVPVVVLTGFLGSGKTTLLNHLLTNALGVRIGVIVNDFGAVGIDAMMVAGQVDSMISLGNGCLCCAVDANDLDDMLGRLARPSAGVDVIVIEASGLAEPRALVRMVVGSAHASVTYGGLVQVVDAAEFPRNRRTHPELDQHVRLADLIVLNKTDLVDVDEITAVLDLLTEAAPDAPVVQTVRGRLDPALLFDPSRAVAPDAPRQLTLDDLWREQCAHHDTHLHAGYQTVSFSSPGAVHPRRLVELLEAPPPGIYRMKGFVDFGAIGAGFTYEVQTVGRHIRMARQRARHRDDTLTRLVAIGVGLDPDDVHARIGGCLVASEDDVDPNAMLPVFRYLADD